MSLSQWLQKHRSILKMDQMSDYDIRPNSSAELRHSLNFGPSLVYTQFEVGAVSLNKVKSLSVI